MPFLSIITSPIVKYGAILLAAVGAFVWYSAHERSVGAANVQAAVAAATQAEQTREQTISGYWTQWSSAATQQVIQQKASISDLQKQIAVAAAKNTSQCLDAGTVRLLNSIGRGSQTNPNPSTGKPNR